MFKKLICAILVTSLVFSTLLSIYGDEGADKQTLLAEMEKQVEKEKDEALGETYGGIIFLGNDDVLKESTAIFAKKPKFKSITTGSAVQVFNFEDEIVTFPDVNLEMCIREAIGRQNDDDDIYSSELEEIEMLNASNKNISDISGIEELCNLQVLFLENNNITDISPLEFLDLTNLYLSNNNVSNISSLHNMTNMWQLEIDNNNINDISPLSELWDIGYLNLSDNNISNISPLQGLYLYSIKLSNNNISSVNALEDMEELSQLWLSGNQISNISPLSKLTLLSDLRLGDNNISNITPLTGLKNLQQLNLDYNNISDLTPLSGLTKLRYLNLPANNITDVTALNDLKELVGLSLWQNKIYDIQPLAELTKLNDLGIQNNFITDISALRNMTQLKRLWMYNLGVSDISALSNLTELSYIAAYNNKISDLTPLHDLNKLVTLLLKNNQISDISSIVGLPALFELSLNNNQISDVSPIKQQINTSIGYLNLENNKIKDISALTSLKFDDGGLNLYLGNNEITDFTPLAGMRNINVLGINNTNVTDISFIKELTMLSYLYAYNNQISDLSPLKDLTKLNRAYLWSNKVKDLSNLSSLSKMSNLNLADNLIDDISPIQNLSPSQLYLQYNNLDVSDGSSTMGIINKFKNNGCDVKWQPQKGDSGITEKLPNPKASPDPANGKITDSTYIQFSVNSFITPKIYYTTDGSEPTVFSKQYKDSFTIDRDTTFKVKAVQEGFQDSDTVTFKYELEETQEVPATVITLNKGTKQKTIKITLSGEGSTEKTPFGTFEYAVTSDLNDKKQTKWKKPKAVTDNVVANATQTVYIRKKGSTQIISSKKITLDDVTQPLPPKAKVTSTGAISTPSSFGKTLLKFATVYKDAEFRIGLDKTDTWSTYWTDCPPKGQLSIDQTAVTQGHNVYVRFKETNGLPQSAIQTALAFDKILLNPIAPSVNISDITDGKSKGTFNITIDGDDINKPLEYAVVTSGEPVAKTKWAKVKLTNGNIISNVKATKGSQIFIRNAAVKKTANTQAKPPSACTQGFLIP